MVSPHFFERRRALFARVGKNLPARWEYDPQGGRSEVLFEGKECEETRKVGGARCFLRGKECEETRNVGGADDRGGGDIKALPTPTNSYRSMSLIMYCENRLHP